MARKVFTQAQKDACVKRMLAGKSAADEARRMGATPQAVRRWRVDYLNAHPEEKPKEPPAASPPPEASPGSSTPAPAPAQGGGLTAALEAIGVKPDGSTPPVAPSSPLPSPPVGPAPSYSPASSIEDEQLVFMVGSQLMGWSTRGLYALFSSKLPLALWPAFSDRLQSLCVLSDAEKAGLRPCAPVLAPIIRRWIGSNENVALVAAGSVVAGGLFERTMVVKAAVSEAIDRAIREGKIQPKAGASSAAAATPAAMGAAA